MTRSILSVVLIICNLLLLSTGVGAQCEACPNCDYESISIEQGDACLNYWTCSGDTITCYYPSVANPGTYNACSYSASAVSNSILAVMHAHSPIFGLFKGFALTAGPSDVCFSEAGVNDGCEPSNNPYNVGLSACTASYGYVGEYNSGLLKRE